MTPTALRNRAVVAVLSLVLCALPCTGDTLPPLAWAVGFFDSGNLLERDNGCYPGSNFYPATLAVWLDIEEKSYLHNAVPSTRNATAAATDSEFVKEVECMLADIEKERSGGLRAFFDLISRANVEAGTPFNLIVQKTSVLYSNLVAWDTPSNDITVDVSNLVRRVANPQNRTTYKPCLLTGRIAYLDLIQLFCELAEPGLSDVRREVSAVASRPVSEDVMKSILRLRQANFRLSTIAHNACPSCVSDNRMKTASPALETKVKNAVRDVAKERGYVLVVDINGVWCGEGDFRTRADDISDALKQQLSVTHDMNDTKTGDKK